MTFRFDQGIRKRIIDLCKTEKVVMVNGTADKAACNRITARKHLKRLAQEGLLEEKKEGRFRLYLFTGAHS